MLVLVLDWTQCLPQGASTPPAMLRSRMTGFPNWCPGPPETPMQFTSFTSFDRIRWIQFAQSLLTVAHQPRAGCIRLVLLILVVVVIDLPLLRVAVEGSDNPVSLEKPCQASLPPDQQGRHSLGRHPEVQYVA